MSRLRMFKVYCQGSDRDRVVSCHQLVADYESFVVIQGQDVLDEAGRIESCPAEDITDMYELPERLMAGALSVGSDGRPTRARHGRRRPGGLDRRPHHYVVQFVGPVKREWLRAVRSLGAELRRPLECFAYVVRCVPSQLDRLVQLRCVRQLGRLSVTGRIHAGHEMAVNGANCGRFLPATHVVEFFDAGDLVRGVSKLTECGAEVLGVSLSAATATVRVSVDAGEMSQRLSRLAETHGVASIRPRPVYATCNDVAVGLLRASGPEFAAGQLSGRGEVIGICDTGLDSGDIDRIHPDFAGRVRRLISYPMSPAFDDLVTNPAADDGPADVDSGHGTHVAGSAVGSGRISGQLSNLGQLIRGLAHEAELVFQAVEQECQWIHPDDESVYGRYALAGLPEDIGRIFRDAYHDGVRIHSNSWGGGSPGEYDHYCRQLDQFVWEHPDFCVLVAAGNDGSDHDGDGMVNWGSISSPGTAKNCITVGASESVRPTFESTKYGELIPERFPAPPISTDPVADNWQQVAAFSSRGPTRDGRVKPDVVAPGTYILSTRSRRLEPGEQGWARFEPSELYCYMGGSSMATPLTAGAVALIRQHLRRELGWENPPAALIKAVLLATAQRLEPGPSDGPSRQTMQPVSTLSGNSARRRGMADCHQGWGLVSLGWLSKAADSRRIVPIAPERGLETGQIGQHWLEVEPGAVPLRIVLAYTDYPGDQIVNQLDLEVIDPEGRSWWGHSQIALVHQAAQTPSVVAGRRESNDGGASRGGASRGGAGVAANLDRVDQQVGRGGRVNNVGGVLFAEPMGGQWTIRIHGANVPRGPQPYALAAYGLVGNR